MPLEQLHKVKRPAVAVYVKNKNWGFGHTEARQLLPAETHKKIGGLSAGF